MELEAGTILDRAGYRVEAFAVEHGVTAIGYAIVEDERPGRFDVETAAALGVPDGPDRGRLGRKIVLAGDTGPAAAVVDVSAGADLLVHEATFLAEERERARETCHSTAGEAALVAREAGVRMLALTHVSTRYFGHQVVEEARELFPQTVVPRDFDVVEIPFPERGSPELVRGGARASRAPVGSVES